LRKPSEKPASAEEPGIAEAEVLDYLAGHPDFLGAHLELLAQLAPERQSGDRIVDLQRFLVERLRGRADKLASEREQLIALARLNVKSQARVHRAVLSLMAAPSFEHLIQSATVDLPALLGLDVASLCIEATESPIAGSPPPGGETQGVRLLEPGMVDQILGRGREMLLRAEAAGERAIFGPAASLIRSDAVLRLRISAAVPDGLLALGSRKSQRFHPGQGTELLGFLARALECSIRGWLDLPR
jgi:uncharacterized protein YigA (DUF484 family)